MECYLTNGDGGSFKLPVLLEWSFSYGCGKPCDCFEIALAFDESLLTLIDKAVRFRAEEKGETVFEGVVDEAEIVASSQGATAYIHGRGLQALLLDNEVEAAEYSYAGLEQILEKYVTPFGVTRVIKGAAPSNVELTVASGESAWRALEDYMRFGAGGSPRFLKDGTLLLGESEGKRLRIDRKTAVSRVSFRRKRYGVISEVIVKNKALGSESKVVNQELAAEGVCHRRIVNVPRNTQFDTMRLTGEYQIEASKEKERVIALTLCGQFAAFPGDIVELADIKCAPAGTYFVGESRCFGNADGAGTEMILTRRAN